MDALALFLVGSHGFGQKGPKGVLLLVLLGLSKLLSGTHLDFLGFLGSYDITIKPIYKLLFLGITPQPSYCQWCGSYHGCAQLLRPGSSPDSHMVPWSACRHRNFGQYSW